jgi:hypothetical protein
MLTFPRMPRLHSLVFGNPFPWRHINNNIAVKHIKNPEFDPQVLPIQPSGRTRQELLRRMNELLSILVFTFEDERVGFEPSVSYAFCTMRPADVQMQLAPPINTSRRCITIAVHVGYLKAFCSRETTLSERAHLQFHLAGTVSDQIPIPRRH